MLLLAFLGFTNVSRSLPLNDKFLHLTCFCIATGVFYFIFDVEECVFPIVCPKIQPSTRLTPGTLDGSGFGDMPI